MTQVNTKRIKAIADDCLYSEGWYTQAEKVSEAASLIEEMKEAIWEASNSLSLASSFLPRGEIYDNNQHAQNVLMAVIKKLDDESAF